MLTTQLQLLRDTAQSAFWQQFQNTPSIMDGLMERVDSDSDQETYPGLAYAPRPREMEGSRSHRSVPGFSFNIVNKKWESTVDIAYELWKYGKLNAVSSLLGSMGEKARMYPNRLVSTLINTGDAAGQTGHDGQIFFSNAHVDSGAKYTATQDNDLTSAAAVAGVPTVLNMYDALQDHLEAYNGFLDGEGDPVIPGSDETLTVLCSPVNYSVARAVFLNDNITGPISNDMKGKFRPVLNPYADANAEFFTFRTEGPRKPFIYQVAEDVSLTDNIGGDSEFETKDVSFGTFGFYNVGYGDWRYATRHIFT